MWPLRNRLERTIIPPKETPHARLTLTRSTRQSPYFAKDLAKARKATQFIGEGSPQSSTAAYTHAAGPLANTGTYTDADVIFISAEDRRACRFTPIAHEQPRGAYRNINLAIEARASFVIDRPADRNRAYNVGERQIAAYLTRHNYQETVPGLFTPSP